METNNHFNFTGLSSAPAASGPKPTPASGDSPFAHGSPLGFPQQGKSLNGGMNVNGFSTVSHPSTSGTFAPSSPPAGTPPLRSYDCLWDYTPYPQTGGLKDGSPATPPLPTLGQFPLNGVAGGGSRPASPGHGTNLRGAGQEFWGNGNPGPMGLNFDSQELYDSFHDQSFELMQNGPAGFYTASQPSPMLASDTQPFSLPSDPPEEPGAGQGDADAAAKEIPPAIAENGGGLVGSMELEEAQPDLKICSYNGSAPGAAPLGQEGPVLAPGAGSDCLGDASPIAPRLEDAHILSEDPLEPFESLSRDDSVTLNSSSHAGPEESGSLELDPPLEPESPAPSAEEEEEEEAADSCPEISAVPEGESEEAAPLSTSAAGDVPRRRIATQEEVRFPLQHGWRREVRIKKGNHRWQGETWYYGPCGKRMKQFPEVIKYLSRNVVQDVRREHFSFSPRMPVGDFYEERDTPEGLQWVKLSPEEIPSRIQAITGKRGRPRNAEKTKPKEPPAAKRGRGRPPKVKMVDLLSKTDARLLKRLEAQEVLSDEDKLKMSKIKKKMRRKAKNKQKQEAKAPRAKEAKKKSKPKEKKGKPEKGKEKARPKEKKGKGPRKADKGLLAQRRLEERRRQQLILEEMKKPTEDMCLGDHQPLPAFSRIPGLILPSRAFSNCLTVVEFLQSYGKVLGFDPAKDVPSLCALQEGLLGVGDSAGEVQDLLVRLLQAALYDPGLPPYCQSLKILGEKVSEISLNRDTVSEILRCFLMAYGAGEDLCEGLRTKPFQALPPEKKATILAFLVNELNSSALIINEIDKTLENMSNYRKNKWIIEGRLRRLKVALAKKTGRPESEITGLEDGRRRRSSRLTEETGLEMEEEEESRGRKSRREEEADTSASSVPELERQIEKLAKRQMFFRKKLLHSSQTLRAASLGQDRYRRRYWVLPHLGGIFVEGAEAAEPVPQEPPEEKASPHVSPVKEEPVEVPIPNRTNCSASRSRGRPRKSKEELSQHCGPRPPPPVEGCPGQEDGSSGVGDHGAGGRTAPTQLPPDGGDGPGDGGRGGEPRAEIPQGGGGRHVCVQRPRAGEADREAGQEADVLPQEAAPFLTDAASGFSGPGPVPAAVLGPAPPGGHLRGGRRGSRAGAPGAPRGEGVPPRLPGEGGTGGGAHSQPDKLLGLTLPWPAPEEQRGAVAALWAQPPPPVNGVLEEPVPLGQSQHDLSQSAFLSWLSQTQSSLLKDSVLTPDSSPGKGDTGLPPLETTSDPAEEEEEEEEGAPEAAEKQGPWFNLLPRTPCDDRTPLATSSAEPSPRAPAQPRSQPRAQPCGDLPKGSARQLNGLPADDAGAPLLASTPVHAGTRAHGACPRSRGSLEKLQDLSGQPKRRGRPPTKFFKQIEQKYLTQLTEQPVPPEMQSGWWWLQDPEELEAVARALHPRGIREKALHKHLTKHKEFLREVCQRATTDPIFHLRPEAAGAAVSQEALAQWSVMERAYETDLAVLQWVEELEQRVLMADLQIRGWTCPSPDSTREDLQYCEHKVEPLEDITVRSRRDGLPLCRERTNPLDLAVLRLAALEQNVERRYLKEPLWPLHEVVVEKAVLSSPEELSLGPTEIAYEITPRVRTWRQTLERCRSAAQVSLCIYQLEKSIAWEKSVNRVTCLVCRRGDDDEHLLLCDGCDRGCHLYCHRPKMTEVPEGDWFCSVCVSRAGQYRDPVSPRRGKKRKRGRLFAGSLREEEEGPRRRPASRRREGLPVPRYAGEGLSPAKRRGASLRGHNSDLTFCE
ncbi:PREDICTED: bromodomain adjacent to zinc finger domain protein 2A [Calidris pugnax]|uniref:bromodomain adjacent to zinc finger domain protein 2A n=1 Tax=Calidris pugnax TaxID=198806 RepID=UPI00071DDD1C|nr:PREDICTED: bromodomain adjacent to zinc finger domain protein 2A [Calidris pugnax]